ncbi:tRNA (adenosine(37)-N6)-dimethylallyltransferase MiaA [Arenibaculum sp.]|uniref:tRNA (adenosine(37)-N6)-dimethylallyltransferase MiaA n=1 Tax=Arenibaculum sp. TaxID=2865862 RepID=UPI0039C860A1
MHPSLPVVVIGGPTASGKSSLALDLAERFGGTVVNADSMQVYRELRVLTARPGAADLARAPHRLYGVLSAAERCSAARWRSLALDAIREARELGRLPVVVGGTGLYLRGLMEGLVELPPIPDAVRTAAREAREALGAAGFHADLATRDPAAAARLDPADRTRTLRAWEVVVATGRPLTDWQARGPGAPPADLRFLPVLVLPPREVLYARCDRRFAGMLDEGALAEVRMLDLLGLDPELPAMKALGVPELRAHLRGELGLAAAVEAAKRQTRRYAKRQVTWFRHQWERMHSWHVADAQQTENAIAEIGTILRETR